jgi:hypothetical protein
VKLVDDHGTEPLKKALAKITPIEQADYVISTAHKAKGLEWRNCWGAASSREKAR